MDLKSGVRENLAHSSGAGGVQAHRDGPVVFRGIVVDVAFRPHQAVVDLIAYLHNGWSDAFGLHPCQDVPGVFVELVFQGLAGESGPGRRLVLLVRVGPGVAVVEIQGEVHAGRYDAPGEGDGALRAAESFT